MLINSVKHEEEIGEANSADETDSGQLEEHFRLELNSVPGGNRGPLENGRIGLAGMFQSTGGRSELSESGQKQSQKRVRFKIGRGLSHRTTSTTHRVKHSSPR